MGGAPQGTPDHSLSTTSERPVISPHARPHTHIEPATFVLPFWLGCCALMLAMLQLWNSIGAHRRRHATQRCVCQMLPTRHVIVDGLTGMLHCGDRPVKRFRL